MTNMSTVKSAYRDQIEFGSTEKMALGPIVVGQITALAFLVVSGNRSDHHRCIRGG